MEKKLIFQKWIDPFLTNVNEIELPNGKDDSEDEDKQDEEGVYKDSYDKLEEKILKGQKQPKKIETGPVIVGPMGIIPLSEYNIPSKVYCFWMGHTNFDITNKVAATIEKIPGVEAIDVFSRYRFRIAIGKAFLSDNDPFGRSVLNAVREAICPKEKEKVKNVKQEKIVGQDTQKNVVKQDSSINRLKNILQRKYPFWMIVKLANGTIDPRGGATKEELLEKAKTENITTIATSWE